jgi:hypothetical protein
LPFVLVVVVEIAAQFEVVQTRRAAVGPVLTVVDLTPTRVTPRRNAVAVAGGDGPA